MSHPTHQGLTTLRTCWQNYQVQCVHNWIIMAFYSLTNRGPGRGVKGGLSSFQLIMHTLRDYFCSKTVLPQICWDPLLRSSDCLWIVSALVAGQAALLHVRELWALLHRSLHRPRGGTGWRTVKAVASDNHFFSNHITSDCRHDFGRQHQKDKFLRMCKILLHMYSYQNLKHEMHVLLVTCAESKRPEFRTHDWILGES